ncbi:VWA containing CoxE family protein [Kalymmatonema gypsitolerans NIES-4073]|nr:VWA containing CoxE family protein [Scytonema sp. NIES-4073]
MKQPKLPAFLWELFQKLRRRGFPLTPDDYEALRQSLQAGFGWSSKEALRDLCNSLWAKSRQEQEILTALFNQLAPKNEDWQLFLQAEKDFDADATDSSKKEHHQDVPEFQEREEIVTESRSGLPPISLKDVQLSERRFIFVPQFPLTYREVAQTWRRLRRPVRVGPPTELDIEATIARRCQQGVAASVVLRPRRRNIARLLLLVDRQGSMTAFHRFCQEVCTAIQQAGRLEETAIYYFHNVPAEGADKQVLEPLGDELFPVLDSILPQITPLKTGYLYEDPDLLSPIALEEVLQKYAADAFVVVISDAGAVRKYYNVVRLLDTISFIKALRAYTLNYVWLNPLSKSYWKDNTAAQIARHVPMFPLNREGIQQAVNVLRGHQYNLEKPL